MRTALVIGGAGFVGRHLIPKLNAAGYHVVSVDPRHRDDATHVVMTKTGIQVPSKFEEVCIAEEVDMGDDDNFDVVFHLGAHIPDVDERLKGGHEQYKDIALDLAVADYVVAHPPREAFVWPTSCAVDNTDDPYAYVKLTGERIFHTLRKHNIRTVMLRPFSGYGEDQALSYPFPAILKRAMDREDPLTVWGSGMQVRDWVHIDDLTDAFMMAIKIFPAYTPIEIGTGVGTTLINLAMLLAEEVNASLIATDYEPEVKPLTEKAGSSPKRVADTTLAEMFGFEAKISLAQGIERAVKAKRGE